MRKLSLTRPTAPLLLCDSVLTTTDTCIKDRQKPLLGDEDKKAPPSTLILCLLVLLHLT